MDASRSSGPAPSASAPQPAIPPAQSTRRPGSRHAAGRERSYHATKDGDTPTSVRSSGGVRQARPSGEPRSREAKTRPQQRQNPNRHSWVRSSRILAGLSARKRSAKRPMSYAQSRNSLEAIPQMLPESQTAGTLPRQYFPGTRWSRGGTALGMAAQSEGKM